MKFPFEFVMIFGRNSRVDPTLTCPGKCSDLGCRVQVFVYGAGHIVSMPGAG